MKNKLKKLIQKLLTFFPSRLPIGMTEFESWANSILDSYDFPNNRSTKFALATMILHSNNEPKTFIDFIVGSPAYRSKRYFAIKLFKGASNQIAAAVMEDLKNQQKLEAEKEAAQTKSE